MPIQSVFWLSYSKFLFWQIQTTWLFFMSPTSNSNYNNNNLLHLYSAFVDTQSTLHSKGTISSSTTNVQHPPGWCDGSHSAPERPPHTSLSVERRESDEANQCMGMIRRPWWSEDNGRIWPGFSWIDTHTLGSSFADPFFCWPMLPLFCMQYSFSKQWKSLLTVM